MLDFMIIGAMKSATTSLYNILSQHPDIYFPVDKEPDILLAKNPIKIYEKMYADSGGMIKGEASTAYSKYPDYSKVPEKANLIHGGRLKIIYMIRDPYDRAISQLKHEYKNGLVSQQDIDRGEVPPRYINYSKYKTQVERWERFFSPENILIVRFDDFISDEHACVSRVLSFLGKKNFDYDGHFFTNSSEQKIVVHGWVRKYVVKNPVYKWWLKKYFSPALKERAKKLFSNGRKVQALKITDEFKESLRNELKRAGAYDEYNALSL